MHKKSRSIKFEKPVLAPSGFNAFFLGSNILNVKYLNPAALDGYEMQD